MQEFAFLGEERVGIEVAEALPGFLGATDGLEDGGVNESGLRGEDQVVGDGKAFEEEGGGARIVAAQFEEGEGGTVRQAIGETVHEGSGLFAADLDVAAEEGIEVAEGVFGPGIVGEVGGPFAHEDAEAAGVAGAFVDGGEAAVPEEAGEAVTGEEVEGFDGGFGGAEAEGPVAEGDEAGGVVAGFGEGAAPGFAGQVRLLESGGGEGAQGVALPRVDGDRPVEGLLQGGPLTGAREGFEVDGGEGGMGGEMGGGEGVEEVAGGARTVQPGTEDDLIGRSGALELVKERGDEFGAGTGFEAEADIGVEHGFRRRGLGGGGQVFDQAVGGGGGTDGFVGEDAEGLEADGRVGGEERTEEIGAGMLLRAGRGLQAEPGEAEGVVGIVGGIGVGAFGEGDGAIDLTLAEVKVGGLGVGGRGRVGKGEEAGEFGFGDVEAIQPQGQIDAGVAVGIRVSRGEEQGAPDGEGIGEIEAGVDGGQGAEGGGRSGVEAEGDAEAFDGLGESLLADEFLGLGEDIGGLPAVEEAEGGADGNEDGGQEGEEDESRGETAPGMAGSRGR